MFIYFTFDGIIHLAVIKMKIGIDIDETLVDTMQLIKICWHDYINKYPNPRYNSTIPNNIYSGYDDNYITTFWDLYREDLKYPPIRENAVKVLKKLKKDNELCIITSREKIKYKDLVKNLDKWLKENDIYVDHIYTDARKKGTVSKKHNIDLLIDDSIEHIKEAESLGIKTIMFNSKKHDVKIQTDNWLDLYKIIKEL